MTRKFYTGLLDGKYYAFRKFSELPYHLERVKYVTANTKTQALRIREKYENLYLLLPLAPDSKRAGIITELTSLKVNHDIHG